MMCDFEIHEHLPLTRPLAVLKRIPQLLEEGHGAILDLEDSAMCVFDDERTRALKSEARNGLRLVAERLPRVSASEAVVIRVNDPRSPHFELDLLALEAWVHNGHPLHVSLPKVDCQETVARTASAIFEACGSGNPASITPIIEVGAAQDRIPEILRACPGPQRNAYFGFYDYALDQGMWPIPDMSSEVFWEIARQIAKATNAASARFLQTPPSHVASQTELRKIKAMTMFICDGPAGISTLGRTQTEGLAQSAKPREMPLTDSRWTANEARSLAEETVRLFESNTRRKRSFAIVGDRFIPPHEYLAARAHLESNAHAQ